MSRDAPDDGDERDERDERELAAWRARYAEAPLGRWRSATGTFAAMGDEWHFRTDGTGEWHAWSGAHGEERSTFVWRTDGVRRIALRWDGDDEDELWDSVAYDFRFIDTDVGRALVLYELDGLTERLSGRIAFSWGLFPLARVAD